MKDFKGDESLKRTYKDATQDLGKTYNEGTCVCFAGPHGVGKTYTCSNILKRAVEKGYHCLYVTLGDIVANVTSAPSDEKFIARKELTMIDFLVVDEFDPRWMPTDASSDLFGRTMEDVFRKRASNNLPLFMCTNSPNVVESFHGPIKHSVESLMHYAKVIPVLGKDFREVYGG
jgi:DNA replication protein DnaC